MSSHPESLQHSHELDSPVGLSMYQVAALKLNPPSIAKGSRTVPRPRPVLVDSQGAEGAGATT